MIDAAPHGTKAKPLFMVQKLDGKFTKTVMKIEKGTFVPTYVEADRGWLVTMLKGPAGEMSQSVHIETMEEMHRLGFDRTVIPLVDEDGEPIPGKAIENKGVKRTKELINA